MVEGNTKKSNNRGLVVILCVLGIAIVGLIIGIVVTNVLLSHNGQDAPSGQIAEDAITKHDKEVQQAEAYRATAEADIARYQDIQTRSAELLASSTTTSDDIINLYSETIEYFLSQDLADKVSLYVKMRNDNLLAKGFREAALEELLAIDYSIFNEPEQYRYYDMIIGQANDLNRNDVVAKYEPLRASVKGAYDKNYAAAEAAAEGGSWEGD